MPSITFYTPWSSKRSGPSVTNPMFITSQSKPSTPDSEEEEKKDSKSSAPQIPTLPVIETSTESMIKDEDWTAPAIRHGKLKIIGGSDEDQASLAAKQSYNIPDFDFGPTLNFAADKLPEDKVREITAGAPPSLFGDRQRSNSNVSNISATSTDERKSTSLNEQWRRFTKFNGSSSGLSVASRPGTSMSHFRKVSGESRASVRPDGHHRRTSSGLHSMYSMANTSNLTLNPHAPSRMLTPESMDHVRPSSRGHAGHSRQNSGESSYFARPYSRGTPSPVRHIGPLINLANSPSHAVPRGPSPIQNDIPGGGLIGTIDARQREKEAMKASGAYNPIVAQSLRDRQTAAAMQQMAAAQMQSLALQSQQMQMALAMQQEQIVGRTMTMGSGMNFDMGMGMNHGGYAPSMGTRSVYGMP